jgi:hypothetical protein
MFNMTLESCLQVVYTSWPSASSCLPNSTVSSVLETEVEKKSESRARLKSERAGCPCIWSGFWSSSPKERKRNGRPELGGHVREGVEQLGSPASS